MLGQALVDARIVDIIGRGHELEAGLNKRFDGFVEVMRAQRHVLDAFALVLLQVFLDLPGLARVLVDRDSDLAFRARHGAGVQPRQLAFDVEIPNLAEVEEALVEPGPFVQAPAIDVVGQVIDVIEADALWLRIGLAQPFEIDIVDRALRAIAVDEIDLQAADSLDGRDLELIGADLRLDGLGAHGERAVIGVFRIGHAEGHGRSRWAVLRCEALGEGARLRIDDEVDVALAIEHHVLRAVLGDRAEAHRLEEAIQSLRIRMAEFHEFEAVRTHGILFGDGGWRRIVRERSHDFPPVMPLPIERPLL